MSAGNYRGIGPPGVGVTESYELPNVVLNIKLAFSGRTVCALKCRAISPDLLIINGLEGHKSAVKVTQHIDMAVRDMLFPEIAERQDTFWAL